MWTEAKEDAGGVIQRAQPDHSSHHTSVPPPPFHTSDLCNSTKISLNVAKPLRVSPIEEHKERWGFWMNHPRIMMAAVPPHSRTSSLCLEGPL